MYKKGFINRLRQDESFQFIGTSLIQDFIFDFLFCYQMEKIKLDTHKCVIYLLFYDKYIFVFT